jgi:hypothetical protein
MEQPVTARDVLMYPQQRLAERADTAEANGIAAEAS